MTDETDRTTRRAIRHLGESAPPPPSYEDVVVRRPAVTARSRRSSPRLLVSAPIAAGVVVVVLLAALAARGPVDPMAGPEIDPSRYRAEGVVVPTDLLDGADDLDRADRESDVLGEVAVLDVPDGGVVAVSVVAVASFPEGGASGGDRPTTVGSVGGMVPCVSDSVAVEVGEHVAVQASGPVDEDVLREVLATATVDDEGELVVSGPPGTRELGRLPAGWRTPADGSVLRTRSEGAPAVRAEVTTVRLGGVAWDALSALRCPAPVRESPPVSAQYPTPDPAGQGPRSVDVGGTPVELGVLDEGTQLVLVPGEPGVAMLVEVSGETWPYGTDVELARLAASVDAVDNQRFDARAAALAEERIEEASSLIPDAGTSAVATGAEGEPWLLVTQDSWTPDAAEELCLVEPHLEYDLIGAWWTPTHCIGRGPLLPDLTASTWAGAKSRSRFLFAVVPAATDRLEVRLPNGLVRTGEVLDDPVDGFGPVAVVDLRRPLEFEHAGTGVVLDGTVQVRALGADGEVLATRSFGPTGCAPNLGPECLY